jgi:choline dehydrogenase
MAADAIGGWGDTVTARRTIVVGAGSSGGIIASRLSEDESEQVILIEAGPDYPSVDDLPEPLRDASNPQLVGHDWELESYFLEPIDERPPVPYPRGRVVGGSSAVNGTIAQRGQPGDFEAWAAQGNDEWSWDKVLPYYKRFERDLDFGDDTEIHGSDGPVPIFRRPREEWAPAVQAFDVGCRNRGFAECPDHNAPESSGFGPIARNQVGSLRASTLITFLQEARDRPNLEIRANTLVTRVLFDGTRAVGVEVEGDGKRERINADRVVLSAGAIKTPQILTLSGVGRRETLERLGIEPVAIAPGVGRNLRDHPFVPLVAMATDDPEQPAYGFLAELKYSFEGYEFENELMAFPSLLETASMNFELPSDAPGAVMVCALIGKPKSVGWLDVNSADHTAPPEIHLNFLGDDSDVERMAAVVRLSAEVMTSEPMLSEIAEKAVFPDDATLADDDALRSWMRLNLTTGFHGSGTCRMGPDGDEEAVLTQRLEVRGTENLYVGDASIMPDITTGLTNITCYMIGEKLADWLRER